MPVKIYKMNGSSPSRAVMMTVEILKLDVETEEVNTIVGDQFKPEIVKKNPLHTVPILEDNDLILADSHAIIKYLVSKYGAEKREVLYPVDLRTRAIIDQRLHFDTGYSFPKMLDAAYTFMKDKRALSTEQLTAIEEVYGYLEKYLSNSVFLAANHITLADISLVATVSSLDAMVPIKPKCMKLTEWFETLKEQDWYKKVNVPGLATFVSFVKL